MAFKRILVPLDGSEAAEAAIAHAANLARTFSARMILLRVLDSTHQSYRADSIDWRMQKVEANRYLHGLAADEALAGLSTVVELDEGRPAECIIQFAERSGVDLIAMSAYGASGPTGFPFGGTAHKILSGAKCSVAIVRQPEGKGTNNTSYQRVLVPVDGGHQAEMALQVAVAMGASNEKLEIVVLHLVAAPLMPRREPLSVEEQALRDQVIATNTRAAEQHLHEIRQQFQSCSRIACRLEVTSDPVRTIARYAKAEKADLLIMSSPDEGETQGLNRESLCQAIQAVTELPLVVLQANGRK